jgi:hypothetical protein
MNEKEKVRERIAELLSGSTKDDYYHQLDVSNALVKADAILSDPSICIKAEDQELPENPYLGEHDCGDPDCTNKHQWLEKIAYSGAQQDMLNAGWVKVLRV